MRTTTILLLLMAMAPASASAATETEDYRAAYALVLEERWTEAVAAFDRFVAAHPDSDQLDAALFWQCYARDRGGQPAEEALECYERMIERFPRSAWADDAHREMVRLARDLARQGEPKYVEHVRSRVRGHEEDVEVLALAALADIGDEASIAAILERLEGATDRRLRAAIVTVLEDIDTPAVTERLAVLVRSDDAPEVRAAAVDALEDRDAPEVTDLLLELAGTDQPREVRAAAVSALAERGDARVVDVLTKMARGADERLAEDAIEALGELDLDEGVAALDQLYGALESRTLRAEVIHELGDEDTMRRLTILARIVRSETDVELAALATRQLGEFDRPEAGQIIDEIARSDRPARVRAAAVGARAELGAQDEAAAALARLLRDDEDPQVRAAAAHGLGELAAAESVSVLARAAGADADRTVRAAALRALGEIGTPAARDALIELLGR
jgi:HEAT repeat protein